MQILIAVILTLCMVFAVCPGCLASAPDYWTAEQRETAESIRMIDDKGLLYEINYVGDYHLDEVIAAGTYPNDVSFANIQKVILPNTTNPVPHNVSVGGCSSFAAVSAEGHPILCRNYDWFTGNSASIVIHTAPSDGYRVLGVSDPSYYGMHLGEDLSDEIRENLLYSPFCILEGVNEKGLSAGLMMLHGNPMCQDTGKQQLVSSMVIRVILDRAATVDEAIEVMKQYDVISGSYDQDVSFHWCVADLSGRRAVLEYVNNELVVNECPLDVHFDEKTGASDVVWLKEPADYILSTNFYVTEGAQDPKILGDNGYWRYETLCNKLKENPHPTKEEAMGYLDAIHYGLRDKDTYVGLLAEGTDPDDPANWAWISIDSSVYDLQEKTLNICVQEDFSKAYTFSMEYQK